MRNRLLLIQMEIILCKYLRKRSRNERKAGKTAIEKNLLKHTELDIELCTSFIGRSSAQLSPAQLTSRRLILISHHLPLVHISNHTAELVFISTSTAINNTTIIIIIYYTLFRTLNPQSQRVDLSF